MIVTATGTHGAGKSFINRLLATIFPERVQHNTTSHSTVAAKALGYQSSKEVPKDYISVMKYQWAALEAFRKDFRDAQEHGLANSEKLFLFDRSPIDFLAYTRFRARQLTSAPGLPQRQLRRINKFLGDYESTVEEMQMEIPLVVAFPPPSWGTQQAEHRWSEQHTTLVQDLETLAKNGWATQTLHVRSEQASFRLVEIVDALNSLQPVPLVLPSEPIICPACLGSTEVLLHNGWIDCILCHNENEGRWARPTA